MKHLGIKYQLRLIALSPALIIALLFASVYTYQYQQLLLRQTALLRLETLHQLLPFAKHVLLHPEDQAVAPLLHQAMRSFSIHAIALYNQQGKRLLYQGDPAFTPVSLPSPHTSPPSLPELIPIQRHAFQSNESTPFSPPAPFSLTQAQEKPIGWLFLQLNPQPLLIQRYFIEIITLSLFLSALLIAFISCTLLSRHIYHPINRLRRSMQQILKNEFETQIKHESQGELGLIEAGCIHLQKHYLDTLQDMNHHIEQATNDLQQSLLLLEEKNIELTLDKKKSDEKGRQKSEFIANMSHEIRTPMNGIVGFTTLLLEHKLTLLQHEYVKTIQSSAQEMLTIVNNILDYSKIDAGKLHLDHIPTSLRLCIDDVLALLTPHAHQKKLTLIALTDRHVPGIVLGDPWRLKQILRNLLSNAIKFTEQGQVIIQTQVLEESAQTYQLHIAVIDTGIGLSPQEQLNLFHAYQQADTHMHRHLTGSGLGLVICKQLVEHMQGHIHMTSHLNQGSTFSITLHLDKLMAYEQEKQHPHAFSTLTVLCFEPHSLYLDSLCEALAHWHITCIRLETEAAFYTALTTHPQATMAFVGIEKPTPSHPILMALRAASMPCILMSTSFVTDPALFNADAFLSKPIQTQKLQSVIESLLRPQALSTPEASTISCGPSPELLALRLQLQYKQPKLLIADDNPVNQHLFHTLLESARVDVVSDGELARLRCDETHYALILLDLNMPHCNGLDAATSIRQTSLLNQRTPIFLISASPLTYTASVLKQAGIQGCLPKPIDEQTLLQTLLHTLEQPLSPPIDWDLCLKKLSGNTLLAQDFLTRFIEELIENRKELLQLKRQPDLSLIEKAAHKLHGACCFCGVPLLQACVKTLEIQAKQVNHLHDLEDTWIQLFDAIDAVIEAYPHIRTNYEH